MQPATNATLPTKPSGPFGLSLGWLAWREAGAQIDGIRDLPYIRDDSRDTGGHPGPAAAVDAPVGRPPGDETAVKPLTNRDT